MEFFESFNVRTIVTKMTALAALIPALSLVMPLSITLAADKGADTGAMLQMALPMVNNLASQVVSGMQASEAKNAELDSCKPEGGVVPSYYETCEKPFQKTEAGKQAEMPSMLESYCTASKASNEASNAESSAGWIWSGAAGICTASCAYNLIAQSEGALEQAPEILNLTNLCIAADAGAAITTAVMGKKIEDIVINLGSAVAGIGGGVGINKALKPQEPQKNGPSSNLLPLEIRGRMPDLFRDFYPKHLNFGVNSCWAGNGLANTRLETLQEQKQRSEDQKNNAAVDQNRPACDCTIRANCADGIWEDHCLPAIKREEEVKKIELNNNQVLTPYVSDSSKKPTNTYEKLNDEDAKNILKSGKLNPIKPNQTEIQYTVVPPIQEKSSNLKEKNVASCVMAVQAGVLSAYNLWRAQASHEMAQKNLNCAAKLKIKADQIAIEKNNTATLTRSNGNEAKYSNTLSNAQKNQGSTPSFYPNAANQAATGNESAPTLQGSTGGLAATNYSGSPGGLSNPYSTAHSSLSSGAGGACGSAPKTASGAVSCALAAKAAGGSRVPEISKSPVFQKLAEKFSGSPEDFTKGGSSASGFKNGMAAGTSAAGGSPSTGNALGALGDQTDAAGKELAANGEGSNGVGGYANASSSGFQSGRGGGSKAPAFNDLLAGLMDGLSGKKKGATGPNSRNMSFGNAREPSFDEMFADKSTSLFERISNRYGKVEKRIK